MVAVLLVVVWRLSIPHGPADPHARTGTALPRASSAALPSPAVRPPTPGAAPANQTPAPRTAYPLRERNSKPAPPVTSTGVSRSSSQSRSAGASGSGGTSPESGGGTDAAGGLSASGRSGAPFLSAPAGSAAPGPGTLLPDRAPPPSSPRR
jgi:hypothetical protein